MLKMESMWTVFAWDNLHLWKVSLGILRQLVEKLEEELNAAFASIFTLNDFDFDILLNEGQCFSNCGVAAVAEWYRYRTVVCFVTGSSPVPLKTRRVGQRCTLNLSRAEASSRWCGVVVRRGGASSGVVHVT
ncbi:uncharacterized protein TNCV_198081 [Trichonephila clavipes]|nr:uncharacterized protein TNCV_198081 [Trichonephila clavipes]